MSGSKRTIVVTGASGNNGLEAAQVLARDYKDSVNLRLLVRDPSKIPASTSALGEVVKGDFSDKASLEAAFKGADGIFLVLPFVEDAQTLLRTAVEAAKSSGVKFILKLSAIGADKNSTMWATKDHGQQEEIVAGSGIPFAVVRPTFFYSNLINFNQDSLKKQGVWYGSSGGDQQYSAIDTGDIAAVAAKILSNPDSHNGQRYELTGPELITDNELAEWASAAFGKTVKYVDSPTEQWEATLKSYGLPQWRVDSLVGLETVKRKGWAREVSPNVEKILGRKGKTYKAYLQENKNALN